jgi:hypothetical protein
VKDEKRSRGATMDFQRPRLYGHPGSKGRPPPTISKEQVLNRTADVPLDGNAIGVALNDIGFLLIAHAPRILPELMNCLDLVTKSLTSATMDEHAGLPPRYRLAKPPGVQSSRRDRAMLFAVAGLQGCPVEASDGRVGTAQRLLVR